MYRCITQMVPVIFPTLLADIQRPNRKSAQGPISVNIQSLNPYLLYLITFIISLLDKVFIIHLIFKVIKKKYSKIYLKGFKHSWQ